jgi:predicted RNase H-like HicB family nuclease
MTRVGSLRLREDGIEMARGGDIVKLMARRRADRGTKFVTVPNTRYIYYDTVRAGVYFMNVKAIVHEAEEGGFWAEVPAIPGCATQGETMEELVANLHEAIEGCLSVDVETPQPGGKELILDIAI